MTQREKLVAKADAREQLTNLLEIAFKNPKGMPIVHVIQHTQTTFTVKIVTPTTDCTVTYAVGILTKIPYRIIKGDYRLVLKGFGYSRVTTIQQALSGIGYRCDVREV